MTEFVAFLPDGKSFVTVHFEEDRPVRYWDVESGEEVFPYAQKKK